MLRETSWSMSGGGSMPVRRVSKKDASLGRISVLEYMDMLEPKAGEKCHIKGGEWKELPKHLSELSYSPITKAIGKGCLNAYTGVNTKKFSDGHLGLAVRNETHELKDEEDDFKSSVYFSRFLRSANLVSNNVLQSNSHLPKVSRLGMQGLAIECQQAGAAVGCYFGNASLAESAPDLGALMGSPSRETIEESLAMSNLSSLIVAMAFQNKIPEKRPVNASFCYRYEWESPKPQEESTRAEIYVKIEDCKTKKTYVMFPLAYEAQDTNPIMPNYINPPVRTFLNEVRDKNFARISTGQFSLST